MRRLICLLITLGLWGAAVGTGAAVGAASPPAPTSAVLATASDLPGNADAPLTIPRVRSWAKSSTGYRFASGARIVVARPALRATASQLAGDLKALTGVVVPTTAEAARTGDVVLDLGTTNGGDEGYRLVSAPVLRITGNTDQGVFLGTRTLLQVVKQNRSVPGGTAVDWPLYPERSFMVDVGRQYFTVGWLKKHIREMAYLKMNQLHLHLNDFTGYRLESLKHPEVVSAKHYTRAEIKDLVAYAAKYHVEVIPELDFPGHSDPILAAHPELRLFNKDGVPHKSDLDLSNPATYALLKDLITEALPLFPGRYWHIGADEYLTDYANYPQLGEYAKQKYGANATPKDAYYGYFNWANAIVRAAGKQARAHNDGMYPGDGTITVDKNIIIGHWSLSGPPPWWGPAYTPQQLIAMGYTIQNAPFTPTHHTAGGWAAPFNVPAGVMYETWDPSITIDGSTLTPEEDAHNLGSMLKLWCDESTQTEDQLGAAIYDKLRVMAQHTWRSVGPPFWFQFAYMIGAVGSAPQAS